MRTTVTNAAMTIARADPSAYCAPRKKFTTRFAIRLPPGPPTSAGVRNSPRIGMNTKMQAVMIPARICGRGAERDALPRGAPPARAPLDWGKSDFSRGGEGARAAHGKDKYRN